MFKKQSFIFLLLASCLLTPGCRNSSNHAYTVELKASDKGSQTGTLFLFSVCPPGINSWNTFERNRIEIYNLDSGTVARKLQFFHDGPEAFGRVSNFFIETLDSLIVDCDSEMSVGISDGKGKILKEMSYREDISGRSFVPTPPWIGSRPYKVGNTIYYLQSHMSEEANGILTEEKRKETFLNVALNTETGISYTLPLVYPAEMVGQEIWESPNVMRTINEDGLFVYHFSNLTDLFVSVDNQTFGKVRIESNYKLKLNGDALSSDDMWCFNEYHTHMLRDIFYDKYRNCYYIFYMKRNENPDGEISF
ncbi:MAG: DUF4221 family protein [Bacteroidales bacterium]